MAFESKASCSTAQPKKQRNAVGNFSKMNWDKDAMRTEVSSYPDATVVNWSDLARRYNIKNQIGEKATNGGQIAQEWLKSVGLDVNRFKRLPQGPRGGVRRKK